MQETIVVVGNGMAGHKLIELMIQHEMQDRYHLVKFCEEPYACTGYLAHPPRL